MRHDRVPTVTTRSQPTIRFIMRYAGEPIVNTVVPGAIFNMDFGMEITVTGHVHSTQIDFEAIFVFLNLLNFQFNHDLSAILEAIYKRFSRRKSTIGEKLS